jgi:opacity protein-like surface antigen
MVQGIHPRVWSAFILIFLLGAVALPQEAFAGTSPAGQWVGTMRTPDDQEVDVFLNLDQQAAAWTGTLESEFLGETSVSGLKVTDTRISFTFKPEGAPFPAHFSGSYIAGDDRITGTFSLRGNSRFVKFKRVPGSETVALPAGAEPVEPARIRHDYHFGVSGRVSYWASLHVVKDENYNLNNLTAGDIAYDGTLHWFPMDGFNLFARYFRGGQKTTDNAGRLERYADIGVSADSYLKLDGFEFGIMGYLGSVMMRNSKFNPYLTFAGGKTKWELTEQGRGSTVVAIDQIPLEGNDWAFTFGLGTEYEFSQRVAMNFEWAWRYFLTGDTVKWPDPDNTWTNTHAWALSAGLTVGIF